MDSWVYTSGADRAAFEHQGGFIHTSAITGNLPSWQPRLAVDAASLLKSEQDGASVIPRGVAEVLCGMQAAAAEHARLASELLSPSRGTPSWLDDSTSEDEPIPRGSLLNTQPSYVEPLHEYCMAALSHCDESALALSVQQWLRWGVDGHVASCKSRKRRRSDDDGADSRGVERDSRRANEKEGDALDTNTVQCHSDSDGAGEYQADAALQPGEVVDALLALVMSRRRRALHPPTQGQQGPEGVDNPPLQDVASIGEDSAVLRVEGCVSMPLRDAVQTLRGVIKSLKAAVHRERRAVRRYCSDGLDGLVAHHAKEANAPMSGNRYDHPSIPLLHCVSEQHGRVIGAYDALSDAQSRFVNAQRAARVALEDAAEAAKVIVDERQAMSTLLRSTAVECNAVDEIRQLLVQELRVLKEVTYTK